MNCRWHEVVFAWLLSLFIAPLIVWMNQNAGPDELTNERVKYFNSLWERENLRMENAELDARLADLNEKMRIHSVKRIKKQESGTSVIGPTRDYENLRRRVCSNTVELRSYVVATLQSLEEKMKANVTRIKKIKNTIGELYASLLKDVSDLANVDNYSTWREQESYDLSRLVQNRLDDLQNPADCAAARKLVCDLNKDCGYGCQLHHVTYCFIVAYATDRTLILNSKPWKYCKSGWETVFLPLSDTCVSSHSKSVEKWSPDSQNSRVLFLPIIDIVFPRPPYLPLKIPEDLAPRLSVLHGDPVIWWIGQILKYMLRPQPKTSNKLDKYAKKLKFQNPIVGVHIRRTDKLLMEAKFHDLKEYMTRVEQFYKSKELSGQVYSKRIFLATDEPKLFFEARRSYPDYEIIGDENISETASLLNRDSIRSLWGIITDIHFLSRSDYLVCTFSSQVCRVAYEIMNSLHPDASSRFTSLDDIYYFGGQTHKLNEVVLSHQADGPHEIDLQAGDLLFVHSNLQNGYSFGRNLRTGKEGTYPTFKVILRVETEVFGNYSTNFNYWD